MRRGCGCDLSPEDLFTVTLIQIVKSKACARRSVRSNSEQPYVPCICICTSLPRLQPEACMLSPLCHPVTSCFPPCLGLALVSFSHGKRFFECSLSFTISRLFTQEQETTTLFYTSSESSTVLLNFQFSRLTLYITPARSHRLKAVIAASQHLLQ